MESKVLTPKERSKEGFGRIASNYHFTFFGKHSRTMYDIVLQKTRQFPYRSVLDVGCGTGTVLSLLSEGREVALSGIDISPEMIRVAKRNLKTGADLEVGDSEQLPWRENSFDLVVCTDSFHHYPNPERALKEMRRVLKPHRWLIIADAWWPTPIRQIVNSLVIPPSRYGDVRVYSTSEIYRMLEASGFRPGKWERVGNSGYVIYAMSEK